MMLLTRKATGRCLAASLLVALSSGTLLIGQSRQEGAQETQSTLQTTKGLVLKHRVPDTGKLLEVTLPRPQEAKLKNGLRVLLIEHHKVPILTMRFVVMSGGLSEPRDQTGLAEFTATLLREGTRTRTSRQITDQLELMGAQLFGAAGASSSISLVNATGPAEDLNPLSEILADIVRNPTFKAEEISKYLARTISTEEIMRSDPYFLAQQRFYEAIYGQHHPAGKSGPSIETLKKTTPEHLARFHAAHYRPNNSILIVAGDVKMKQLLPTIERLFGDWVPASVPPSVKPETPPQAKVQVHLVNRPDSVQTVIQVGNLGIPHVHDDYFPMLVMNRILGGPMGRLFLNLREDKGYTYNIFSLATGGIDFPGVWLTGSSVRTEVTAAAMSELMAEFKRMRESKVTPVELENAKRAIIGRFALSLELPSTLLQNTFQKEIFRLPDDYWVTYPKNVAAVTTDDIQRVARKYINLEKLQIVAVGDAAKIEKDLKLYGPLTTYDASPNDK